MKIALGGFMKCLTCSKFFKHFQPNGVLYFPKGGLVKIALGGALFSMGQHVTSTEDALHFAEQMQAGQKDKKTKIQKDKRQNTKEKKKKNKKTLQ